MKRRKIFLGIEHLWLQSNQEGRNQRTSLVAVKGSSPHCTLLREVEWHIDCFYNLNIYMVCRKYWDWWRNLLAIGQRQRRHWHQVLLLVVALLVWQYFWMLLLIKRPNQMITMVVNWVPRILHKIRSLFLCTVINHHNDIINVECCKFCCVFWKFCTFYLHEHT